MSIRYGLDGGDSSTATCPGRAFAGAWLGCVDVAGGDVRDAGRGGGGTAPPVPVRVGGGPNEAGSVREDSGREA